MFCGACGNNNLVGSRFCKKCGIQLIDPANEKQSSNQQNQFVSWYYIRNNEKCGPYSLATMILEIDSGSINRSSFVWRNGMERWYAITETELLPYLKKEITEFDNKFVWLAATVPFFLTLFFFIIDAPDIFFSIAGISGYIFANFDVRYLRKLGMSNFANKILVWIALPVYLFYRASKTDGKYSYGITWIAMLTGFIIFIYAFL